MPAWFLVQLSVLTRFFCHRRLKRTEAFINLSRKVEETVKNSRAMWQVQILGAKKATRLLYTVQAKIFQRPELVVSGICYKSQVPASGEDHIVRNTK